ncbi:MAG TPA: sugar transferase [Candidatus Dormibacteraeota bacterium]
MIASTLRDRNATTLDAFGTARAAHDTQLRDVDLGHWTVAAATADGIAATAAAAIALAIRFGATPPLAFAAAMVPLWLTVMALAGAYERRAIVNGAEQCRRVINGAVWMLAASAIISFALRAGVSRELLVVSIPGAAAVSLIARYALCRALHRRLNSDAVAHRVLAIGLTADVCRLAAHMNRAAYAGFRVIAGITPAEPAIPSFPAGVRWAGPDLNDAVLQAHVLGADTIAVLATHLLPDGQLRRLSWELEGTGIDLVVAPVITDVAGPRITTRPIAGLPLLCVEKPQFSGPRRLLKEAIDKVAAALGLLLLSPLLLAIAVAVRLTSRGPALYRQQRVGLHGRCFRLLKFRSMYDGAESERSLLDALNERDGPLFKLRRDPRLTPIGGFLRRWSLDELPQLWNVLRGDMSLVGPRPPLPSEVERYVPDARRRLVVKPGLTGLWQVSGRADLSWEESVRLDLHYVDNWSVGLDLAVLAKTCVSVLRGEGAY